MAKHAEFQQPDDRQPHHYVKRALTKQRFGILIIQLYTTYLQPVKFTKHLHSLMLHSKRRHPIEGNFC